MNNIFDTIVGRIPKPKPEDVQRLQELEADEKALANNTMGYDKMPMETLVAKWKANPTPELTGIVLHRSQPTINSALKSYAPGQESELKIQAAKLALESLKGYQPSAGASVSTYLFNNLKRLNRISGTRSSIIKYPEQAMFDKAKINDARERFEDDHGREPSLTELADMTGISARRIDKLDNMNTTVSLSSTINPETHAEQFGTNAVTDDDYFEYVYSSVGPIDQKIMEWTSGLHGKPRLSNEAVAARLKITPAAVSQRKSKLQRMLSDVRGLV